MKSKLLFFLGAILVLSGCNKIKDAVSTTVNTNLQNNIPVVVTATKSANGTNTTAFSASQDLSLSDNADLQKYLSKINDIGLSNLVITITGLSAGQTINSISLDISGVGTVFTQTNISMTNNSFTPVVSSAIFSPMASKLKADNKLTFTVSGDASGAMTFNVGCNMDANVKVSLL